MAERPDLKFRSAGAASAYGVVPITEKGSEFVERHILVVPGAHRDPRPQENGTVWFPDGGRGDLLRLIQDEGLIVTAGVGPDPNEGEPWEF